MPRIARPVFAGVPHHITQRGNRREDVFFSDADRAIYLRWLAQYCTHYNVHVLAYCLMSNHVHLVAVPESADALEKVFRPLHTRHAQRINRARHWTGHVWQGRYFSSALDDRYLWAAIRYVECNPVRAGIVLRPEDYRWSSAPAHCLLTDDPVLTKDSAWIAVMKSVQEWSRWLAEPERHDQVRVLRRNVERGLPCGAEAFVTELEQVAGRMLRPLIRGRPNRWGRTPFATC